MRLTPAASRSGFRPSGESRGDPIEIDCREMNSLPRPLPSKDSAGTCPRPILPIYEPSQQPTMPDLPSPARRPAFDAAFALTTHLIPAAYPRTYPDRPLPASISPEANKTENRGLAIKNAQLLLEWQNLHNTTDPGIGSRRPLWVCLNRYVRKVLDDSRPQPRLTLFLVHANGFPKEIWEPMLQHLLRLSFAIHIDEIWSWESVQHGDSALVNAGNLGGLFDWSDNARDILNFLIHYLPASLNPSTLPVHLPRVSTSESESRKSQGYTDRKLVAIGHSYGGSTSALAATNFPVLFSSVVLVDPIIIRCPDLSYSSSTSKLILGALQRRERWPSRKEAFKQFQQTPFFASWDPEVLKIYVECGLTDDGRGGVMLKTSGVNEAVVFADRRTGYDAYERIQELDGNVALRWIMPGDLSLRPDTTEAMQERVWLRPTNVSNIQIPNAGHLVVQEAPQELAQDLDSFFWRQYSLGKAKL